jgi:hypothetical protein
LLITKDDQEIFDEWCRDQVGLYDHVVCLDGSGTSGTAEIARRYRDRMTYLHERDYRVRHKTCHGLRGVVHQEIVRRFGTDNWVMCCHADEFCYHDPRKVALRAAREGYDAVSWYSLHFYPHPEELAGWRDRQELDIRDRSRHYHWNYRGSGLPWSEDRLYRNGPRVAWDGITHCNVRPLHIERPAPFQAILRHYKVFSLYLGWYEVKGGSTHYREHWVGQEFRTGLPFRVERVEDLFVRSVPDYGNCDRFDGTFRHPWNIGEEYRAEGDGEVRALR